MLNATPLIRLYARRRLRKLAQMDVADVQRRALLTLVGRAARTSFGRDHDFANIRSVIEYQKRAPLRRYEDFHESYWKAVFPELRGVSWPAAVPFFAVT